MNMKYIKLYEGFEVCFNDDTSFSNNIYIRRLADSDIGNKEKTIRDICLELEDYGVNIRINIGKNSKYEDRLYKNIVMNNFGKLTWVEIREYLLRIKEFLGDDYKEFMFFNGGWKTIELNEETELDIGYRNINVCIYYNKLKLKKYEIH